MGCGIGQELDYLCSIERINGYGLDLVEEMVNIAQKKVASKGGQVYIADMENLPFRSEYFDAINNKAALLHLPYTKKGESADLAVAETYDKLKKGGIFKVRVKYGEGFAWVDTKEGFEPRPYQFYDEKSLKQLLKRNGFTILTMYTFKWKRIDETIIWLEAIAIKSEKQECFNLKKIIHAREMPPKVS